MIEFKNPTGFPHYDTAIDLPTWVKISVPFAIVAAGVGAYGKLNTKQEVARATVSIETGKGGIAAVSAGIAEIATCHPEIDPDDVRGIISAGQELQGELLDVHGRPAQPGDEGVVTIEVDRHGNYSVKADPQAEDEADISACATPVNDGAVPASPTELQQDSLKVGSEEWCEQQYGANGAQGVYSYKIPECATGS